MLGNESHTIEQIVTEKTFYFSIMYNIILDSVISFIKLKKFPSNLTFLRIIFKIIRYLTL